MFLRSLYDSYFLKLLIPNRWYTLQDLNLQCKHLTLYSNYSFARLCGHGTIILCSQCGFLPLRDCGLMRLDRFGYEYSSGARRVKMASFCLHI